MLLLKTDTQNNLFHEIDATFLLVLFGMAIILSLEYFMQRNE